ncbi:LysR family transcriptional regulator [Pseudomonas sp. 5P_3.1_Bac2]|uniref:LysR family transcriptional regulator n=1 Tax=Pseudomonas sp. 5P_3.1_Bac2 TaxID=2971617 RepID=UPI0021C9EA59|nr:LysR family transcriptional regulator [Pseudomonas sp. 5P_3.1_Bac2]MCU1718051.1 LysR family transcriptional regulator [Pseudomonas sp. 5P_3.1_Bac2]
MNDLRQLRHFVSLAEHGHFARAAEAVHLTQPALSRSIQALESQLGCRLVDRHSRGCSLTEHGQLVLQHARRLLAGSRALSNAVSQLTNLASGELRLGAGPFPAARLVPQAVGCFTERYAQVQVRLQVENWLQLRQRLLDDELELFVADIREIEHDPQLCITPLQRHQGVMFCRPDHPLVGQGPLSYAELRRYPLASPRLPQKVEQQLALVAPQAEPLSILCDNVLVLKELVCNSQAISLAPWDVVAQDVSCGRLAVLPLVDALSQHSAYGIVSHSGHSLSPAAAELQAILLSQDGGASVPPYPA